MGCVICGECDKLLQQLLWARSGKAGHFLGFQRAENTIMPCISCPSSWIIHHSLTAVNSEGTDLMLALLIMLIGVRPLLMSGEALGVTAIKEEKSASDSAEALDLALPGCSKDESVSRNCKESCQEPEITASTSTDVGKSISRNYNQKPKTTDLGTIRNQSESPIGCNEVKGNDSNGRNLNKDLPVYLAQADRFSILNLLDLHEASSPVEGVTSRAARNSGVSGASNHIHDADQQQFRAFLSSETPSQSDEKPGTHNYSIVSPQGCLQHIDIDDYEKP